MKGMVFVLSAIIVAVALFFAGCTGKGVDGSANASGNASGVACAQVISYAENPLTGECIEFPNACTPANWEKCEPVAISQKPKAIENETLDETLYASGDERVEVKESVLNGGITASEGALVSVKESGVYGAIKTSGRGNVKLVNCRVGKETVFNASGNSKIFVVSIDSPETGEKVSGNVSFAGSAFEVAGAGDLFEEYELKYGYVAPGETLPARWHAIASAKKPVKNGALASWDTFGLMNGEYRIELRLKDAESRAVTAYATVELTGGLPAA